MFSFVFWEYKLIHIIFNVLINESVKFHEDPSYIRMCNQWHKTVSKFNRKCLGNNPLAGSTVQIWGTACRDSDIPT